MINFQPSQDDLRLRSETEADLPFLAQLYASTRHKEMAASGWPQEQIDQFLKQQFELQREHYLTNFGSADFWIIKQAGKPIGRLYLDEREDEFRIIDIALSSESRGQGIGGQLLSDLQTFASSHQKCIRIHVEQNNPAMNLYRRLGFENLSAHGIYQLMQWSSPTPHPMTCS